MASNKGITASIRTIYNMITECFPRGSSRSYVPIPPSIQIPHPSAIGVVRVVVQAANIKRRLLTPRPSVLIGIRGRSEFRSTSRKPRTYSPSWFSESTYIIIYSQHEDLELQVRNHRRFFRTGIIGHSIFPLILLNDEPRRVGQELPILKNAKTSAGTILSDIFYYPVLNPGILTQPRSDTGIVTLRIQRARYLKWETYSRQASKLIAVASFGWTDTPFLITDPSYCSDFPVWNSVFDFLCFGKASTVIVIKVAERYEGNETIVYGHLTLALDELLVAQDESKKWWPLSGCPDGELRVAAEWKPIEMDRTSISKAY